MRLGCVEIQEGKCKKGLYVVFKNIQSAIDVSMNVATTVVHLMCGRP